MFKKASLFGVAIAFALLFNACAPATQAPTATPKPASADLSALKSYVETQSSALHDSVVKIQAASNTYYKLAKDVNFDYKTLWAQHPDDVRNALTDARTTFIAANPQYERMEGVVAGVPDLSQYDVILDAGTAGTDGGDSAVPFDLTLPDGRILPKPGNLFEVTEATLWGTDPAYSIAGLQPDFNGNGQVDLGDSLPDANVLKSAADAFEKYTADLHTAAVNWQPTQAEAFGALVANVPTFSDFMDGWKNSRFIAGNASRERGFVATSRLSDLSDNILSWQTIYKGLSPAVKIVAADQDKQITKNLVELQKYVSDLYAQEKAGKHFTAEEADLLTSEGQNRATAIAGQISQVAAQLGIKLEN
jgi:hypothetical protein